MSYGSDITEGLPLALSNPVGAVSFSANAEAYDIAINDMPFFLNTSDEFPYRRETAQYRKQQIDQSNEPGEQSITGWWVRSQSSFHAGTGIKFFDRTSGESIGYRFADSQGVDVWTKGQATLLHDVIQGHITTGAIRTNGRPYQSLQSIQWGTTNGALLHDGLDLDKIDSAGAVTNFVDYNVGSSEPIHAVCNDGVFAYFVTNNIISGTPRLHFYKKPLTGDDSTGIATTSTNGDCTLMFTDNGITITNAVMEFVKDRIVLCLNNKVYEIASNASALPTPVYTNPNTNYIYTSIAASGPAIYTSGYSGIYSTIHKYTLNASTGAMPVLSQPVVVAEFPAGEKVFRIYYYLGKLMIGTNKGIRVAAIDESVYQSGNITYGPLVVETTQSVYDFTARDRFVWATTGIGTDSGLIRIDLSANIEGEELRFAWANDLQHAETTVHKTTAVTFAGDTSLLMFATTNNGTTNGNVYVEHSTNLCPTGYIKTGLIRFATLENKIFKTLKPRIDNTTGGLTIKSIDASNNEYLIGTFAERDFAPEVSISYPAGAQEYLAFKFTLTRSADSAANGPKFSGYQIKALPAATRQHLIQYPLACYDREKDALGNQVGHEGAAYEKLILLEAIENIGDTIRIEDFRTGESYLGLIEQTAFINRTPTDKRFSGFGGILNVVIRTL